MSVPTSSMAARFSIQPHTRLVYLGKPTLSLTDVACLLGYSEGAAFTRAFKRWTGRAPSQARR